MSKTTEREERVGKGVLEQLFWLYVEDSLDGYRKGLDLLLSHMDCGQLTDVLDKMGALGE